MKFSFTVARGTAQRLSVTIHARNCPCVSRAVIACDLKAESVEAAKAEVDASEDATARGIPIKVAKCAKES